MRKFHAAIYLLLIISTRTTAALTPAEILIIANGEDPASVRIAKYYANRRAVPHENILLLSFPQGSSDSISRSDYDKFLADPVRQTLFWFELSDNNIKCLLTTYGIPIKVKARDILLENIDILREIESYASVDSELSMVLHSNYDVNRWQLNELRGRGNPQVIKTLMVSRLDGPGEQIITGIIDKAIRTEKYGLKGTAYIDSRGIKKDKLNSFGYFDESLRQLAVLLRQRTSLAVKEERTAQLFQPGQCPETAIYCGWYSLRKYIDAFDFVEGAIGYHIASFEAMDIRDPNSTQWCPAMLKDGVTATIGPVAEPYLLAFPQPKQFFLELLDGNCLVEAFYKTKPFNSWQMILIGDPLYRPFKKD